jgi:hypothetical protein
MVKNFELPQATPKTIGKIVRTNLHREFKEKRGWG